MLLSKTTSRTLDSAGLLLCLFTACRTTTRYEMVAHRVRLPLAAADTAAPRGEMPAAGAKGKRVTELRDGSYRVDIPEAVPFFTCQRDRDTCWAAAESTLLRYLGLKVRPEDLVARWEKLSRACADCPKYTDRKKIEIVGYRSFPPGESVSIEDTDALLDGVWEHGRFEPIQYLVDGLPFVLLFQCQACSVGHAFVVIGARYSCAEGNKPSIDSLLVMDPDCSRGGWPTEALTADVLRKGTSEVIAYRPSDARRLPLCQPR